MLTPRNDTVVAKPYVKNAFYSFSLYAQLAAHYRTNLPSLLAARCSDPNENYKNRATARSKAGELYLLNDLIIRIGFPGIEILRDTRKPLN